MEELNFLLQRLYEYIKRTLPNVEVKQFDKSLIVRSSIFMGATLWIRINDEDKLFYYIHIRTRSWEFDGDRTDLHDIISFTMAAFFRMSRLPISWFIGFGGSFVDFKGLAEIGDSYLFPSQSEIDHIQPSKYYEYFENLCLGFLTFETLFWKFLGCPCEKCRKERDAPFDFKSSIPSPLKKKLEKLIKPTPFRINHTHRLSPEWIYYRDFKRKISLVKSEQLCSLLRFICISNEDIHLKHSGLNGFLYLNKFCKNFVSYVELHKSYILLKKVDICSTNIILSIAIENKYILVGKRSVLVKECNSGFSSYKVERERIREHMNKQRELLFPFINFKWAQKVDPDQFEKLIKDLLEREDNVVWVRKSGITNEPDKGRDLLLEMYSEEFRFGTIDNNVQRKAARVAVQCKALFKTVGKSDVTDIRDTIEFFDAQGYFLVVSSYVGASLVEHLNSLKAKGKYLIDWWTRDEIELRLRKHDDLVTKYSGIVEALRLNNEFV